MFGGVGCKVGVCSGFGFTVREVLSPGEFDVRVQSLEILSPASPLPGAPRPHRRMDRIRMLDSMKNVVMRDGDDGTNVRVAAVSILMTDVRGEVCPSVPHPLGRVEA
jgi:hypothetical protein